MANSWDSLQDKNGVTFSPKDVDWGGEERTNHLGLSGRLVQEWIKSMHSQKWGAIHSDGKFYYAFADDESRDKWIADPANNSDLVLGTFEAPANYVASIEVLSEQTMSVMKGSTGTFVEFKGHVKSKSGATQIENLTTVIQLTNNGFKQKITKIFKSEDTNRVVLDDYLRTGVNTVSIVCTGQDTNATARASIIVNVVDLAVALDTPLEKTFQANDTLTATYRVTGAGTKYVEWYLDGVKYKEDDVLNVTVAQQKLIDFLGLSAGVHSLQMRAYIISSGQKFYSKTVYREFFTDADSLSNPVIALAFELAPGELIKNQLATSDALQFTPFNLQYAVYDPTGVYNDVEFSSSQGVSVQRAQNNKVYQYTFTPYSYGELDLRVSLKGSTRVVKVTVQKSDAAMNEATSGLVLKLSAVGRSNSEVAKDTWEFKGIKSKFKKFAWNTNSGWDGNNLIIRNGAQVEIDFAPFSSDWKSTGGTIEFTFSTSDVLDEDAVICDLTDEHGKLFKLTASSVQMSSSGSSILETRFKANEEHKIAILVQKLNSGLTDKSLVMVMVDGILCGVTNYANSDTFQSSKKIVIGNPQGKVTTFLKTVRVYNRQLAEEEELANTAVDSGDVLAVYNRNDIYQEGTEEFSLEKVQSKIPTMVFVGAIDELMNKEDKKFKIKADVYYTNLQAPEFSFTAKQIDMTLQGTSSLTFPRKNFKIKLKGGTVTLADGTVAPKGKYAFKPRAQAVSTYCLKADFAESSGTHNTGIARIINSALYNASQDGKFYWRTKAQEAAKANDYDYDVRTAIDGFPIVCFYKKTDDSPLQYLGQYNFNNDKSTESVFGFRDIPGFNKGCVNYDDKDLVVIEPNSGETLVQLEQRFNSMPSWHAEGAVTECPQGSKDESKVYLLKVGFGYKFFEFKDGAWKDTTGAASQVGTKKKIDGRVLNPVECWEVLQNANDLALFKDSSTFFDDAGGKKKWETAFECRFPDGGKDTNALKRLCDWLVSCKNNQEKFNREKADYFDLRKVGAYYSYFMRFLAVDQVVKNTMLCTEDGYHWFFINYDNDTVLGVRNDGPLKYGPYTDRQTLDSDMSSPSSPVYAYAGHDSTLWNCFEADPECMKYAREADAALTAVGFTYAKVLEVLDRGQSDQWCERIYNTNGRFKYIDSFINLNKNYLALCQGSRRSHRHWLLRNRFDFMDAKFVDGEYRDKSITFKIDAPTGSKFRITAGKALEYGAGSNNVTLETNIKLAPGESHDFTLPQHLIVGDPIRVYAANNIQGLDLSLSREFVTSLVSLDLAKVKEDDGSSRLKVLNLNTLTGTDSNQALKDLSSVANATALEELNIRNFTGIKSLPLAGLKNMQVLRADGSGLTSFEPAAGSEFKVVSLPINLQSLTLQSVGIKEFKYEPNVYLKNLHLADVSLPTDSLQFVTDWVNAQKNYGDLSTCSLILENVNWTGVSAEFLILLARIPGAVNSISGYIQCTSINSNQYNQIVSLYGDKCFTTKSSLRIDAPKSILIAGPAELTVHEAFKYNAHVFPITEVVPPVEYVLIYGSNTVAEIKDNGSMRYSQYRNVILNADTGQLNTDESVSGNTTVRVQARLKDDPDFKSEAIILVVKALSYPTSVKLSGKTSIVAQGTYAYKLEYLPAEFTGKVKSIKYSAEGDTQYGYVLESSNDTTTCQFYVSLVPEEDANFILSATVAFNDGTFKKAIIQVVVGQDYAIKESRNPAVFERLYAAHLCASAAYMTYEEAAAVTPEQLGQIFKGSGIGKFPEFKHFKGIHSLPESAFEDCRTLSEIEFPETMTKMGKNCFYNCAALLNVVIPETVIELQGAKDDKGMFMNCSSLKSITISSRITTIPDNFLRSCASLKSLDLPAVSSIESGAFAYCSSVETVKFSPLTKKMVMSDGVFCGLTALKTLEIPKGTTFKYSGYAPLPPFGNCNNLQSIVLPASMTSLELPSYVGGVFSGCLALKDIYCYSPTAPTFGTASAPFGSDSQTWTGRNSYDSGENVLHVLQTAVGFSDTGSQWKDPLQHPSKCGFTVIKELLSE